MITSSYNTRKNDNDLYHHTIYAPKNSTSDTAPLGMFQNQNHPKTFGFWVWFWDLGFWVSVGFFNFGFGCSIDFNLVMENYSYPSVKLLGNC